MNNKLQEITEKIYLEGISRGKEEAEKLLSEARTESDKIIRDAEKEAKKLVAEAEKEAAEIMKNTLSELKISFRHGLNTLKQEVESVVTCKIVEEPVSEVFSDNRFVARLIETIAEKWSPESNKAGIEIYISEEMIKDIEQYFSKKATKILSEGVVMHPVESMEKGFEIRPHGKDYKISVTESDFVNYIKEFLRPKLIDLLFEKNK